jgi:hypothetical protein
MAPGAKRATGPAAVEPRKEVPVGT